MTYMGEMGGIAEKDNKSLPNADRLLPDDVPEESVGEGGSHDNFGMFDSNPFGTVNLAASFPEGSCEPQLVPCAPKPAATTTTTNDVADSVADGGAFGSPDVFSSPDGFASEDFNLSFGGMDDVDALNQQDLRYNLMLRGAGLAEHSTADAPSHPKMEFPEYPAHHPMNHPMYPPHMPLYYPGMPTMPVPYYGMPYPPFPYNPWMAPYSSPFLSPPHAMPGTNAIAADPAAIARQRRLVADSVRGKRRRHALNASSQFPSAVSSVAPSAMPSASLYGHPIPSSPSILPWTNVNPDAADSANAASSSPFVPAAPLPPLSPAVVPSSPKAIASPARCASPVPTSSPAAVGKTGAGKAAAKSPLGRVAPLPAAAAAGKSPAVKFSAEVEVAAAPAAALPVSPVLKIEEDVFVPTATAPAIPATVSGPVTGQQVKGGKASAKQQRDERRVKRLLRNRVSAQQARERKKNYVAELEQRCEMVERSNAEIEGEIAALMAENERLRQSMRRAIRETGVSQQHGTTSSEGVVVRDSVFFHRTALCGLMIPPPSPIFPTNPHIPPHTPGAGHNNTVQQALESLVVWDSVFFHRIALCGYEFEQAYAFFPLLPLLMRLLATATPFRLLLPILGAPATFALVGLVVSNTAFVAAAYCLFRLTDCVLSDTRLAFLSSLFFCLTPASAFYSAIYSESIFALLAFAAMWRVVSGRWISASLLIALSAAARPNGVLHAGFFLFSSLQAAGPLILRLLPWQLLQWLIHALSPQGNEGREGRHQGRQQGNEGWHTSLKTTKKRTGRRVSAAGGADEIGSFLERKWQLCRTRLLPILLSTALCCLLSFSLLLSFQFFAFTQFCRPAASTTPRDVPSWCMDSIPYIYGYVQRKYWDVGFLRYFQLKQLPNFLLASPTLLLSLSAVLSFALSRLLLFLSLGLLSAPSDQHRLLFLPPPNHPKEREREEEVEEEKVEEGEEEKVEEVEEEKVEEGGDEGEVEWRRYDRLSGNKGFFSAAALPFLLQLLFMTAVATLVMHVQVATRFLSSSPPLYWFLAHLLTSANTKYSKSARPSSEYADQRWELFMVRAWIGASVGYAVIGSLLFINFYPFT
ncbi:unnamed protein product [Closterium sp. Yama58-4]|nr:unnamed protein product [Closterium sp. Yama58-4]